MPLNSSSSFVDCGMKYFLSGNLVGYVCILPVFLSVFHVGLQRWRGRSPGSVSMATSNIDIYAYNMVFLELLGISGVCLYIYALYTSRYAFSVFLTYLLVLISGGPILFLIVTCVDCYLAVLHPVTYLRLKSRAGARIRNMVVAVIWLITLIFGILRNVFYQSNVMYVAFSALALTAVLYCCTAVVWALVRPQPGRRGGAGECANQPKKRALYTMVAVIAALLVRFVVVLVTEVMRASGWSQQVCLANMVAITFHLPSSLILPLLFLQRARRLPVCFAKTSHSPQSPKPATASNPQNQPQPPIPKTSHSLQSPNPATAPNPQTQPQPPIPKSNHSPQSPKPATAPNPQNQPQPPIPKPSHSPQSH